MDNNPDTGPDGPPVDGSDPHWRVGDDLSQVYLDVAAGRSPVYEGKLSREQLRLAHRHGLLGLLAHSPNRWLRNSAAPMYLVLSSRQRVMTVALRRVLQSLHAAGVRAAVLKGPYLAANYGNPALRTYGDLDLLVPPGDLRKALEVIGADEAVREVPPKRPEADKRDIPFHDPSGYSFNVDIHWDLFSYTQLRGCADGATTGGWKRATEDRHHVLGPLWHLPSETSLAFLGTHAVLDHRFRLILFRDLAEIARRDTPNWKELIAFAERWRLRNVTYFAWLMASKVAAAPVPERFLSELRPSNLPARTLNRTLPRTDIVRFNGHRPHLVNLATVLLHDQLFQRVMLAVRAPVAFPGWTRRVTARRTGHPTS